MIEETDNRANLVAENERLKTLFEVKKRRAAELGEKLRELNRSAEIWKKRAAEARRSRKPGPMKTPSKNRRKK